MEDKTFQLNHQDHPVDIGDDGEVMGFSTVGQTITLTETLWYLKNNICPLNIAAYKWKLYE